jgi:hypothetical protein
MVVIIHWKCFAQRDGCPIGLNFDEEAVRFARFGGIFAVLF